MRRLLSALSVFVASMFVASTGVADMSDPSAATNNASLTHPAQRAATTSAPNVDALKRRGDRAFAARRLSDAIDAYQSAYEARNDPLVAGRLGLAFRMLDDPKWSLSAARFLYLAVVAGAGTSQTERSQFFEAYTHVRRRVCRLKVSVTDMNATIDIGNGSIQPSRGAFWAFIEPGRHELIARLDGHDDIRKPYECLRGDDLSIEIAFPASDKPAPDVVTIVPTAEPKMVVVHEPIAPGKPPSRTDKPWRFGGGVAALFGVAPSSALGVTMLASYRWTLRPRWAVSIGGGMFTGWTPLAINDAISTLAFVAHSAVCVHHQIAFACPAFAVGAVRYSFLAYGYPTNEPVSGLLYGAGIQGGLELFFWRSIGLRLQGDIYRLGERMIIDVRHYGSPWTGTSAIGSLSLGIVGKL